MLQIVDYAYVYELYVYGKCMCMTCMFMVTVRMPQCVNENNIIFGSCRVGSSITFLNEYATNEKCLAPWGATLD